MGGPPGRGRQTGRIALVALPRRAYSAPLMIMHCAPEGSCSPFCAMPTRSQLLVPSSPEGKNMTAEGNDMTAVAEAGTWGKKALLRGKYRRSDTQ
eukprot:6198134-Pleurochrysis_carterae.AAC.1